MSYRAAAERRESWFPGLLAMTAVATLAGVVIGILAFVTARYGPTGSNWSFRGNGALAIYALVPAALAAGWTAVVFRYRFHKWAAPALAAGLVGLVLAISDGLLLPLFGVGADRSVGPILLISLVAWSLVAPALALTVPARQIQPRIPLGVAGGEAAAIAAGLIAGLALATFALPPGS